MHFMKYQILKNFVVIEGLDGAGTSTQTRLLGEKIKGSYLTFEPTNNKIGQLIRSGLKKEISFHQQTLIHLFVADRTEHLYGEKGLVNICNNGQIVICDRYLFSTHAYQSLSLPFEQVFEMNSHFPLPEMVFFINTSPQECQKRITQRNESKELFESDNIQDQILNNYIKSFSAYQESGLKIQFIDGHLNMQDILKQELDCLKENGLVS
jgi:dTMP kinase